MIDEEFFISSVKFLFSQFFSMSNIKANTG